MAKLRDKPADEGAPLNLTSTGHHVRESFSGERSTRLGLYTRTVEPQMPAAATLASLPAEIHARIAALCALQDRRFKHAKLALQKDTTFPVADPSHTVPAPSTVGALSVLSKYWNQVAEPYRFSVRQGLHSHRLEKVFLCNG